MTQIPVSLQLYTLRDDLRKDIVGTLRRVSQIGYRNVELAGFGDISAKEYHQILSDLGLQAQSAHVGMDSLKSDGLAKTLADYKEIGCSTIIIPHLGAEYRDGGKAYPRTAELLNKIGANVNAAGFKFGYHNHNFEFDEKFEGKSGMEWLMNGTEASLVKLELDTYWALFAGLNPVDVIDTYADRVQLLHIKDMDPADRSFAPVGTGTLPLDEIVDAAKRTKVVEYLIVEQDSAIKQTPLESVEISFKNLKAKGYV